MFFSKTRDFQKNPGFYIIKRARWFCFFNTMSGEEHEPTSNMDEIIMISSDSNEDEPIPINEQTGRGKKRKADNQNGEQEQDYYQIKPVRDHHSQKFNMTAKNYGVHFNNVLDDVNLLESRNRTYGIFDHLIKDVTEGMNSTDQVRFVLSSNQLQTPISIPFCSLEELTTEKVLSHVEKVVQSNEEFRLNTTVSIDLIRVEMPRGSGRLKRTTLNIREYLKKKRSVIPINNKDDLCLARALAVSIARMEKDPRYNRMLNPLCTVQRERAFDLHEAANVPLGPCGLKEVDLSTPCDDNTLSTIKSSSFPETRTMPLYIHHTLGLILILRNPSTYIIRPTILMSLPPFQHF